MKHSSLKATFLLALAGVMLASTAANASTTAYTQGNLILGFRQVGGSANSIVVNLGPASVYRDATATINTIGAAANFNTEMAAQFGANWYTDGTVSWGVIGAISGISTFDGDASKTLYGTLEEAVPGTVGTPYNRQASGLQTTAATNVASMGGIFAGKTYTTGTVGLIQSNSGAHTWNTDMAASEFGYTSIWNLEGTVGAGSQLDLFRMAPGSGAGTYEGTFSMGSNGAVSFGTAAVPEPSRALLLGLGLGGLFLRRRR